MKIVKEGRPYKKERKDDDKGRTARQEIKEGQNGEEESK